MVARVRFRILTLVFALLSAIPGTAFARPEYAAQEKLNCMSCHFTPWGGGPRNVTGKAYGSHGASPGRLSALDEVYADLRALGYFPHGDATQGKTGASLMEAAVSGSVPISAASDGSETRALLTYNIAPAGGAEVREAYARFQPAPSDPADPFQVTAGRFYVPFGLLTDEHRTYARMQTNMTLNNYAVGAAVSGKIGERLHGDFAAVNDFQSGGDFVTGDLRWGVVGNLRWNPEKLPFLFGVSATYERMLDAADPRAVSVYGVLSLDRITSNAISGSLQLERVDAWKWNDPVANTGSSVHGLTQFFIPAGQTALLASVREARSLGYYGLARYNVSAKVSLFYKLDYLDLDFNREGGRNTRHGFGFETYLGSNFILNARFEKAYVGEARSQEGTLAAQDAFFALLRMWL